MDIYRSPVSTGMGRISFFFLYSHLARAHPLPVLGGAIAITILSVQVGGKERSRSSDAPVVETPAAAPVRIIFAELLAVATVFSRGPPLG